LIVQDPETGRFVGVEVKTTLLGVIRLNPSQVAKDVAVMSVGATVPAFNITITGVGYRSYCFGCSRADVRSFREGLNKSWMMRAGSESRRESRRRAA
jgi:hypothetical protein